MEALKKTGVRFPRAKAVIASLTGLSLVKLLLAVLANGHPRVRFLAFGLLKAIAPGRRVAFSYKIDGRPLVGFLRWKDIDSDLQSALELATDDRYRLDQLPPPDFVLDGGANTGLFSLAAASRWPGAEIVAFEPVPSNVEAIEAHLKANHVESLVNIEKAALAGSDGTKRFF